MTKESLELTIQTMKSVQLTAGTPNASLIMQRFENAIRELEGMREVEAEVVKK